MTVAELIAHLLSILDDKSDEGATPRTEIYLDGENGLIDLRPEHVKFHKGTIEIRSEE